MATDEGGSRVTAAEAAESLTAVRDSRGRARRADYPVWFWLATGAMLAVVIVYILVPLADPWRSMLPLAAVLVGGATMAGINRYRRLRGPRGWSGYWELWPVLPVAVVMAGAWVLHHVVGVWADPLGGLLAAAAAVVVYVATGLTLTTRRALG